MTTFGMAKLGTHSPPRRTIRRVEVTYPQRPITLWASKSELIRHKVLLSRRLDVLPLVILRRHTSESVKCRIRQSWFRRCSNRHLRHAKQARSSNELMCSWRPSHFQPEMTFHRHIIWVDCMSKTLMALNLVRCAVQHKVCAFNFGRDQPRQLFYQGLLRDSRSGLVDPQRYPSSIWIGCK